MSEPAGPDPAAREQEFVAAARFVMSAGCEHPTLTPQCPFSVEVRPGVRDCLEQCHDLLTARGLPLPTYVDAPTVAPARPMVISPPLDASSPWKAVARRTCGL